MYCFRKTDEKLKKSWLRILFLFPPGRVVGKMIQMHGLLPSRANQIVIWDSSKSFPLADYTDKLDASKDTHTSIHAISYIKYYRTRGSVFDGGIRHIVCYNIHKLLRKTSTLFHTRMIKEEEEESIYQGI